MHQDDEGFFYPIVDPDGACINCKRCLTVCPLKKVDKLPPAISHFGGYSKSDSEIKKSASGGLATAISQAFIESGGIVYGAAYSDDFKEIRYNRCSNTEDLDKLRGSKYAQARKHTTYSDIKNDLKTSKVLFIGLPCDVHAVKILFHDNLNLYTVALICHGPTSPKVHEEFIYNLRKNTSVEIKYFSVRDKHTGWKPYYIRANFDDGSAHLEEFHKSTYGVAFKELKRPSCAKCQFKLNYDYSTIDSDLILGDYHGAKAGSIWYNKWGASQVSVLTNKGEKLIDMVSDKFVLNTLTPHQAIHYNKALPHIIKPRWNRNEFAKVFAEKGLIEASSLKSIKLIDLCESLKSKSLRILSRVKRLIS